MTQETHPYRAQNRQRQFILLLSCIGICLPARAAENAVTVSSLAELAQAAARSDQSVKMKPGVYRVRDFLPPEALSERRKRGEFHYFTFSGSGNTFDLSGVTIELDTTLRNSLRPPIHTDEFLISGSRNTVRGLTLRHTGTTASFAGAALGITGTGNTVRDCTLHVSGSAPYGYGDLFGKGGYKKSGIHITGHGTRLLGCRVFMRSLGHGIYLQEDCADCRIEGCLVEGVMRSTDGILAEKTGFAFDKGFRMVMRNRSGDDLIQPGYMKALGEDAFRTYGQHRNLVVKNCTAKNMRGGFELRTKTAPRIENSSAYGCERGFWVSDGAVITGCKGDTRHGPLLYVEGDNATVEVALLPDVSDKVTVHAVAAIYGKGNKVTIKPASNKERSPALPLLLGFGPPGMGENSALRGTLSEGRSAGERAAISRITSCRRHRPMVTSMKSR